MLKCALSRLNAGRLSLAMKNQFLLASRHFVRCSMLQGDLWGNKCYDDRAVCQTAALL